eukprot:scaffold216235_cov18-Tisochrysis_lutea.AAC.5
MEVSCRACPHYMFSEASKKMILNGEMDHYLHSFFATAIGLGQQALHFGGVLQGADSGVCRAAIALLAQCMQWEFRRPGLPSVLAGV